MEKNIRLSAGILFLSMVLLFGSIFVFLVPPFQSPDESNHFLRAFQVSEGVFFPETHDQRLGGNLPASLAQVCDTFLFLKMNYEARLDKDLIFRCLHFPLNPGQRTFTDFPNTAIYAPTAYLPQAAAIALLRPLDSSPLQLFYACRFANLLVWALLVWAAIRSIPFLKNTLAAFALLPASLVMAASANADVVTNGLCWWLVAGFCAGKLPGFKNLAALAVICANKLIVLPVVLLYWLRSQPSFTGKSGKGRSAADAATSLSGGAKIFFSVALVAALSWGHFAQKWFIPYDVYNPAYRDAQTLNEGVDPARQQTFMLNNPLLFSGIAVTSAIEALPSAAAHFVGKFGWETNYLPVVWLALLWLALAALLVSEENPLSSRQRLLSAAVVVLFVIMFAVTMYALWCPVGAKEVTNFQGRYFVPVAPVAALALAVGWLKKRRAQIRAGATVVLILSNLTMIYGVLVRYYF